MASLLAVEGMSKRFGGLLAVNNAVMSAEQGRITALIGPNGAGKTTLFAMIAGFLKPTSGRVLFRGEDITGRAPHRSGPRRRGAHLPDRAAFRRPDGAREHRGRRISSRQAPRGGAGGRRSGGIGSRAHADARPARRQPDGRGPQAARARPRAGDQAEAPAARRGARRPHAVRDPRFRSGDPCHPRPRCHYPDDRACDAGGDEPVGARLCAR